MSVFVVTYTYGNDPIELNQIRPDHRVWLGQQFEAKSLLASGPMVDRQAGLLIWESNSIEELNALLDQDPFEIAGMIAERTIEEWNPIFGPFSK
jgi:uncharacterized protein YciI